MVGEVKVEWSSFCNERGTINVDLRIAELCYFTSSTPYSTSPDKKVAKDVPMGWGSDSLSQLCQGATTLEAPSVFQISYAWGRGRNLRWSGLFGGQKDVCKTRNKYADTCDRLRT